MKNKELEVRIQDIPHEDVRSDVISYIETLENQIEQIEQLKWIKPPVEAFTEIEKEDFEAVGKMSVDIMAGIEQATYDHRDPGSRTEFRAMVTTAALVASRVLMREWGGAAQKFFTETADKIVNNVVRMEVEGKENPS